ncbi:hypothetical protein ACFFIO_02405 [Citricoccus parietis]|uniref:Right handed beta helix domain-containing protein n=2 Tax=Citricoccus parietis TaxID=592307 RepID=A0ABV6F1F0_9MICC
MGSKPTRRAAVAVVAGLVTSAAANIPKNVIEADDAQIATKIKTEGTQTRTALNAATVHGIQTPDDPIQTALNAQSAETAARVAAKTALPLGNQTATLQAFLNDAGILGVRQVVGDFTLASTVAVPAGVYVDMSKANTRMTAADTPMFSLGEGSTVVGGKYSGYATDYAPHTSGSLTIDSVAFAVAGNNVSISDTIMDNFARAAIYNPGFDDLKIARPRIRGVHGNGSTTIAAGDAGCFGIYIATGARNSVEGATVSHCSIGMIAGRPCLDLNVRDFYAYSIPGQHGAYLQDGTGLNVDGVRGHTINMNLIKVQLQGGDNEQSYSTTISNISGRDIVDSVLSLNSIQTTLTASSSRFNGLAVSNVVGNRCTRVAYIANVRGGTIANISGVDTGREVLTLIDLQDVVADITASRNCGRVAVLVNTIAGADTRRLTIRGVRSHAPGLDGAAGYRASVRVMCAASEGKEITIDGVDHSGPGAEHAVWFSNGEQETLRLRNIAATPGSASGGAVRLISASRRLAEWHNIDDGGNSVTFYPTNLPVRTGSMGYRTRYACNILPTMGTFLAGDAIDKTATNSGDVPGWRCITAGAAYSKVRAPSTAYVLGEWVKAANSARVFEVITAGTSGTGGDPAVSKVGGTVTDGTAILTLRASAVAAFRAQAALAAA